jgi:signal peptide peptidase SppA
MQTELPPVFRLDGAGSFQLEPVMLIDPLAFARTFRAWDADGPAYALLPAAVTSEGAPLAERSAIGVVHVRGPLAQRGDRWSDGYDLIRSRFTAALADPAVGAVVLNLDSPGGHAAGNFEMVRAMRAAKQRSGKPVYAYADELAASAAYALATVADEIHLPGSGIVGSVGVLAVVMEASKLLADIGLRFHIVKSGAAKGDAHPAFPISEDALERMQERIDGLSWLFFDLVAEARGMKTAAVKALEARVFSGNAAIEAGLADGVMSFDALISRVSEKLRATTVRMERNMNVENNGAANGTGGERTPPDHKAFALALGLAHDANETAILTAISDMRKERAEVLRLTGKTTATEALGVIQAGVVALSQLGDAQAELARLRAKEITQSIDAAIEQAKAEGKITTESFEREMRALGAENHGRMAAVLAALPVMVTTAKQATVEPMSVTLSRDESLVARQLGLSPEQMSAHKRAQTAQKGA